MGGIVGLYLGFNIWGVNLLVGDVRTMAVVDETEAEVLTENELSSDTETCDLAVLRAQSLDILYAVEGDLPQTWALTTDEGRMDMSKKYALLNGAWLSLCGYVLEYSVKEDDLTHMSDFDKALIEDLKNDGWETTPQMEILMGTTDEPSFLSLLHAGGPMGETTVFIKKISGYDQVQFATVSDQRWQENRKAYMEGAAKDPCPCAGALELTLSAPIDLTQYARTRKAQ